MNFQEVEYHYAELKHRYDTGALGAAEFDAQLQQLMIQDGEGRWWAKSRDGGWLYHDGSTWVRGTPPGYQPSGTPPVAPGYPEALGYEHGGPEEAANRRAGLPDIHVTGQRIVAYFVDNILLSIISFFVGIVVGLIAFGVGSSDDVLGTGLLFGYFLPFLPGLPYYIYFEGRLGRTPGKMLLGIRVVREETGGVPGLAAATVRTLMRVVDYFPYVFGPLVGLIAMLASQKNQRLGDAAAHTLVVRSARVRWVWARAIVVVGLFLLFPALIVLAAVSFSGEGLNDSGVIFEDDFSGTSSRWPRQNTEEGTLEYADGGYRIYSPLSEGGALFATPTALPVEDVIVEVDAARIGDDPREPTSWGVVCRLDVQKNDQYALGIINDGRPIISKQKGGEATLLAEGDLSDTIHTDTSTNRIRGDCVGSALTLYVNDEKLLEAEDTEFASGKFGLMVDSEGDVSFDNFSASRP